MGSIHRTEARQRRKRRVRKKIRGTPERPRLSVFKSKKHIYAQIIDDVEARTLVDASSLSKEIRQHIGNNSRDEEGADPARPFFKKNFMEVFNHG